MARPDADARPLELWAGPECSVVRIGDVFRNQAVETGHADRIEDLDLVAGLGVRTMRYPILWETVAPEPGDARHWAWADERMARLQRLGVDPIVGLVHHGSGPAHTNLLDPRFPEMLAAYAGEVARRYPWVTRWTPVNEPLTTARFSCLYGHWYPHQRDFSAFLRATVNQCRAIALAMREIRKVNPAAELVTTEDMGKTFSTPRLAYQAEHENQRRWLSLDLLTGRVTKDHPWRGIVLGHGVEEWQLAELDAGLGMPDIVGINHYLTSDRFLDQRRRRYPGVKTGGNGRDRYVDVEAVRVREPGGELGPEARLREVWERYRLPMAVTEAHNGCTREEQVRWLCEVWDAAQKLKGEGADIRAVTIWSVFGAVDWCSLLTRRDNVMEHGLIDMRGARPRRTLLAKAARSLAATGGFDHPALDQPGWWRREDRFLSAPAIVRAKPAAAAGDPILITGATGTLGRAFARICEARGLAYVLTTRDQLDIGASRSIGGALERHRPWAVINTAGFVRVQEAERMPDLCFRENATGPELLAIASNDADIPLATFSSDLVFDGQAGRPYVEGDPVNPVCIYGASKREAEKRVAEACPRSLLIRTSAFFGPWDRHNFIWGTLQALARGEPVVANDAQIVSPTYVPDLVSAALDLLLDGEQGIWHLANPGEVSWLDLACESAARGGLDASLIAAGQDDGPARNTALSSDKAVLLPPLETALRRYFEQREIPWAA